MYATLENKQMKYYQATTKLAKAQFTKSSLVI